MKRNLIIICAIALASVTASSHAKVFLRWGASSDFAQILHIAGGRVAYECRMNINGSNGQVQVFAFQKPLSDLMHELRNTFADGEFCYAGGNMGTISLRDGTSVIKLVGIEVNWKSIVFAIEQPASQTPLRKLMTEIPPFPGSTPVFYAKDENTRMSLSVSSSVAHGSAVIEFYKSTLSSAGWAPLLPEPVTGTADSMFYVKGNLIACVQVENPEYSGETRITLLHKQQQLK